MIVGLQGWSEARIKAYLKKDENPNAYYYRFNDIDEPQATGNWDDDEKGALTLWFAALALSDGCE